MSFSPPEAAPTAGDRLLSALSRIELRSPTDIRVDGLTVADTETVLPYLTRALPGHDAMVYRIQYQIYAQLYCRAHPQTALVPQPQASAPLLEALRQIQEARVAVAKGSLLDESSCFVIHSQMTHPLASRPMVRFYWNLTAPDDAPSLIGCLSRWLDRFHVPFQLKCQTDPRLYDRLDTAVLYCQKQHFQIAARLVAETLPSLTARLQAAMPLMCKPLAPGLALAEDPQAGLSFGLSRCLLLAEAIADAHRRGQSGGSERFRALERLCRRRRLDPQRLYLNPGSADHYRLPGPTYPTPEEAAA